MTEAKKTKTRAEIDAKDKWDLSKIYSSEELWEKDFESLKQEAPKLKEYAGKLEKADLLLDYLTLSEKVNRTAEKLFIYAHLKYDEDTTNTKYQGLKDRIDTYLSELRGYQAFFVPEILALPEGAIEKAIAENEKLKLYDFMLKDILKAKPHTLTKAEEELLAKVSDCLDAPHNIYGMLTNADMTFPVIKDEEGNDVELTEVNYAGFIRSKDRKVREANFLKLSLTLMKSIKIL